MASTRDGTHEDGVFDLLTELCCKTASKYCCENGISQKRLTSKMRTHAYEIILKKTTKEIPTSDKNPVVDLLSFYLVAQLNVKNVAEFRRCLDLKKAITMIQNSDFGDYKDNIYEILKFLIGISNSVKEDFSLEMYQSPFSFGLFDEMLPKPPREVFGSPQPYPYFPSHVFELPYSLRHEGRMLDGQKSQTYTEYTVESFDSKSLIADTASQMKTEIKTFLSPMALASMTSTHLSPYSESAINFPRLRGPRDLQIPSTSCTNVKVSYMSTNTKADIKVLLVDPNCVTVDITEINKDAPDDIWDIASKLPPINERQLIASSPRELGLWKKMNADEMDSLHVVSEKEFIRHVRYLVTGIETSSFPYSEGEDSFALRPALALECVSRARLRGLVAPLARAGCLYRRLQKVSCDLDGFLYSKGLVYESTREQFRRCLIKYRQSAAEIFEESCKSNASDINCMPTLLQIANLMEPLLYELEILASIYGVGDSDCKQSLPQGAELMPYLFNEISMVTYKKSALNLYNALFAICNVYFKFIERFIFEGKLDDRYNEFFIRKDSQYINCRSKRYWDRGFHIAQSAAVPEFLRPLSKLILLCGKSLRLLKLCNPGDSLVALMSSDHPTIECCRSFSSLRRQEQFLQVYRTRCLFVREPVTFLRLQLAREAERRACADRAAAKQAETMDKIIAERKRLAQLIIAEKQHSLRVLERAMAEAKAAKLKAKQQERRRYQLEQEAEKASEEVDSKLRDNERNKIMEYYSKLNMEVEKSKIHTEWKMKRLQLDQSRMQLLSTEERNLKREKLELEHQGNEIMSISILSDENDPKDDESDTGTGYKMTESGTSLLGESSQSPNNNSNSTSDVFSDIYNAAKSVFTVSKTYDKDCDNINKLDAQGNILSADTEIETATSSKVIGNKLDRTYDNEQFLKIRHDAYLNKQKVMAHEFGQLDKENNQMKDSTLMNLLSIDDENNIQDIWTPFAEAKRNKLKVLGAEFGLLQPEGKTIGTEHRTDAQREALVNKLKVLGVEYNLPIETAKRDDPVTVAQEEALVNRNKIMGVEYNLPIEFAKRDDPVTEAQVEAVVNRNKIMGVEYNLPIEFAKRDDPVTEAQEEAVVNRNKIMGVEYNLSIEFAKRDDPVTEAQAEAAVNRNKIMGVEYNLPIEFAKRDDPVTEAQEEAVVNRNKIMGVEYNLPIEAAKREPLTKAQEEAVVNRNKIMGVEHNLPLEGNTREPATEAQEQALKNKKKILSDHHSGSVVPSPRSGLTLRFQPIAETSSKSLGITNIGALTPAEFYSNLNIETPTTTELPLVGAMTGDISKNLESDKPFITCDGFNFPIIDDDAVESEIVNDVRTGDSPDISPSKDLDNNGRHFHRNISLFNTLDGSYNLDEFDPFGVRGLKTYSKDHFHRKMELDMATSCYTHPAIIMEEVKKRPYPNIFASHFEEEKGEKITDDDLATLTACLQRSVMLPLTYQLEVVNNSILTYFLVNLDLYEHLRSLKDYFFLVDGEFSRSICHNLFSKLTKTLNPQELLNFETLHNILDKALGSSISHVHKFSENLSFTIAEPPLSFQHSSPDALQCLSLTYAVRWPLNIILSKEALLRYAKVFQFLVKMRRIFWVLGEDFEWLKNSVKLSKQNSRKLLKSPHYISIQIYRHVMASMIRALDNYIVTTCILSSWTEFENDLTKAGTLDDLYDCHVVYIKNVLFRCLLNNRSTPVMKLLNDIFTVILKFSRVLQAGEWQQQESTGHFTHTSFAQLQELYHLFEKIAKYLHKVVTKLVECGYQRHLVELLSMINLNGYYEPERSKEEHSLGATSKGPGCVGRKPWVPTKMAANRSVGTLAKKLWVPTTVSKNAL